MAAGQNWQEIECRAILAVSVLACVAQAEL